jgi:hypothetical protein
MISVLIRTAWIDCDTHVDEQVFPQRHNTRVDNAAPERWKWTIVIFSPCKTESQELLSCQQVDRQLPTILTPLLDTPITAFDWP